jgi:hypothetical protein
MDSKFSSGISVWEMNLYISLQVNVNAFEIFYSNNSLTEFLYVFARQATSLVLLPFLAFASIFKLGKQSLIDSHNKIIVLTNEMINVFTGNLANDGYRLGRQIDLEMDLDIPRSRARDPLVRTGSACGAAWRHCPPVGPSLHAIAALCSLVAKVVLEARMIKDQLMNRGNLIFPAYSLFNHLYYM